MNSLLFLQCIFLIFAFVAASPPLPLPGDSQDNLSDNCKTPKCPAVTSANEKSTIILRYPLDCHQYVECKGSESRILPCPPDTIFDKINSVCGPQGKVHCVPCYQETV